MDIHLFGNRAQLPKLLLQAPIEISVEGRGTGKSFDIGFKMDQIIRKMPRSLTCIVGKTYGQLLTKTLPSSLKLLNSCGYQKDINYVIGKKPPSYFLSPYEDINQFDNVISFSNGTSFSMISLVEKGSGRGANTDYGIFDEALTLNKEQIDNEITPTNRGNLEFFGKNSDNPQPMHHGRKLSTSMPINTEGRWVLDYANYYKDERGIRIFDIWNDVVTKQIELLKVAADFKQAQKDNRESDIKELHHEFVLQWNEIERVKKKIQPFVSKDGVLFTISNAFDNLKFLGLSYILNSQKTLPLLVFMVEIMNLYYDKVEDCFYTLQEQKHIYYNYHDIDKVLDVAHSVDFNIKEDTFTGSTFDIDCNPSQPLELVFDWGSSICLMTVHQPHMVDYSTNPPTVTQQICQTQINEFFVKPDSSNNIMIEELIEKFCKYYQNHINKRIHFYKDRYGDSRNPNVLNSKTYNDMAIDALRKFGWEVETFVHPGMEPPMSDKYVLWGIILNETNPNLPKFRINGDKCKYTLISMNNAKVKTVEGKLQKDKSSERKNSGVLPEEATHFSDSVDKIIWTKYCACLNNRSTESFVFI